MKRIQMFTLFTLCLFIMSCASTQTNQGEKTMQGAAVGAGVGALLGQVIGGDTEATLIGAGIGAALGGIAGNQIGAYMDRQEAALRNVTAASQAASITRSQNVLTATFRSNMFFDYNSFQLKPGAYTELDRVAQVLREYPQTRIRVEGHTDSKGSDAYNMTLSQKRAQAVSDALVQRGVDPARMQVIGFGESQPISSNDADNRRVNIVITPIQA